MPLKALSIMLKIAFTNCFKFSQLESLSLEILEILEKRLMKFFCMPMGENEQNLKQNALKIAEFCIKNGYNYSDRIHIRL